MIWKIENWFFYKKMIKLFLYSLLVIVSTFVLYKTIHYIVLDIFVSNSDTYEVVNENYTSDFSDTFQKVDKSKWKNDKPKTGWGINFYMGYIHPIIIFTISLITMVSIIGGVWIYRNQKKKKYH